MANPNSQTGREEEENKTEGVDEGVATAETTVPAATETLTIEKEKEVVKVRGKVEDDLGGKTDSTKVTTTIKGLEGVRVAKNDVAKLAEVMQNYPLLDAVFFSASPLEKLGEIGLKVKSLARLKEIVKRILVDLDKPNKDSGDEPKQVLSAAALNYHSILPDELPEFDEFLRERIEEDASPEPEKTSAPVEVTEEVKANKAPAKPETKSKTPQELSKRLYESLKNDQNFEDLRTMILCLKADPKVARRDHQTGYDQALKRYFGVRDIKVIRDNLEANGDKNLVHFLHSSLSLTAGKQLGGKYLLKRLIITFLQPEQRNEQGVRDAIRDMLQELRSFKVTAKTASEPKVEPKPAEPKVDTSATTPDVPDLEVPQVKPKAADSTPAGPVPAPKDADADTKKKANAPETPDQLAERLLPMLEKNADFNELMRRLSLLHTLPSRADMAEYEADMNKLFGTNDAQVVLPRIRANGGVLAKFISKLLSEAPTGDLDGLFFLKQFIGHLPEAMRTEDSIRANIKSTLEHLRSYKVAAGTAPEKGAPIPVGPAPGPTPGPSAEPAPKPTGASSSTEPDETTADTSDEVADDEKRASKERAEAMLTEAEKLKLIDALLKRLDQDTEKNSPAVEAIRELLMEKMTEKGLSGEDLKKLEAYLRAGKKLKDVDLFIGDRSLDDLKKEFEDNKRKLVELNGQLDDAKARISQERNVNTKEMTALKKRMAPLKKDYAVYKQMSDDKKATLSASQRKQYEEIRARLEYMEEEYRGLSSYTGREETDPIQKEIRELEERQSWVAAGVKKLENQEGEETQHYHGKPEKLLGTILTYFAEKEISGRGTPDYDKILDEAHERVVRANEKQSGKFRKLWMIFNPISYLKPTLTGTLKALVASEKNLSKVKPEYIANLADIWRNPEEIATWIEHIEGVSKEEAMRMVVPALIGNLEAAVHINGNTYMNTLSIIQAKGLLANLKQVAHAYSKEKMGTLEGAKKMNAYFAQRIQINRSADQVGASKVSQNMYKVVGRNLAITAGIAAGGWQIAPLATPALALAGGLGIPTTALGVAAAPAALTYGVGKWGIKDPALSEFLRRNAVRTVAAGGLGALAFGAGPLLAGGLVAGGLFAPNLWKNRQAILGGTAKGTGTAARVMGKGASKAAPYAVKAGKGLGYVGARATGVGAGLFGAGLLAGLPLLSERYRKFFGINFGRWDPLNRNAMAHA